MKKLLSILLAMVAFAGMANAKTETVRLEVGSFDKLSVFDNVHVVYHAHPDSTGYVSFKGTPDQADDFIFTNNKGTLKIQVATEKVTSPDLPVVHVYSKSLSSVENASEYSVKVLSNITVPKFTAKLIGNGEIVADNIKADEVEANFVTGKGVIVISGTAGKAVYKMLGAGTIQADELKAENVFCKIMGGGNIGCAPDKNLDVRGIGSTKIYYKGNPKIKKVGGGKILPLTFAEEKALDKKVAEFKD